MPTVALMLTRDRRTTVELCLGAWARAKGPDLELWCFDDGSTEYGSEWLRELGADRVLAHDYLRLGEERGSWRVAQIIREALRRVLDEVPGADWLYICDSDTYPDPGVRETMRVLEARGSHRIYSLFRSSYQERGFSSRHVTQQTLAGPGALRLLERPAGPGCAMLIDAQAVRSIGYPFGITYEAFRAHNGTWDHVLAHELGPVAVCATSYVEHLGRGGLHSRGGWELDRAIEPTAALVVLRPGLIRRIEEIEGPTPAPDRQAGYDPAAYWSRRHRAEGPTYVGARGRAGSEAQAAALLAPLRAHLPRAPRLLDFGCGTGRLTFALGEGHEYHGADVNKGALEEVAKRFPELQGRLHLFAGALACPDGYFDTIVAVTVLQHVPERDLEATCRELARVLAPGGRVLLIEDANPEGAAPGPHMTFRSASEYAARFGAGVERLEAFSAERPSSHYLAVLTRGNA